MQNNNGVHHYLYDANHATGVTGAQRIMKGSMRRNGAVLNGEGDGGQNSYVSDPYSRRDCEAKAKGRRSKLVRPSHALRRDTIYVNPYYIITHYANWTEATKHYYKGSQRVAAALEADNDLSDIETSPTSIGVKTNLLNLLNMVGAQEGVDYQQQSLYGEEPQTYAQAVMSLEDYTTLINDNLEEDPGTPPEGQDRCTFSRYWPHQNHNLDCDPVIYFYHPDYLGHTEYITDRNGDAYQYFHYSAFGETLIEEHSGQGTHTDYFRFNGKELDPETGNYYYGASSRRDWAQASRRRRGALARPSPAFWRGYYDPKVSVWLSVDAMASKGLNITPYAFSHNNPVMLVDPDGNWPNLATLSSWYTSVFNSAAKQTAQHRFNEMKDRTAAARGHSRNIRLASDQSFSVTGSSMRSKIQLADGRAFDQVKGSAGYNILGSKGTASFYGHRKNSLKLYDVTTIDWNKGREGRGVSGGGMGGYGFEVTFKNSNNTVASMYLGEQEFNDLYNNYNSAIDNQFNKLLESIPMVKDYYNNVYGAESKLREFWSNTSDWTPEALNTYQQLTQEYNQALHDFNERWNQ